MARHASSSTTFLPVRRKVNQERDLLLPQTTSNKPLSDSRSSSRLSPAGVAPACTTPAGMTSAGLRASPSPLLQTPPRRNSPASPAPASQGHRSVSAASQQHRHSRVQAKQQQQRRDEFRRITTGVQRMLHQQVVCQQHLLHQQHRDLTSTHASTGNAEIITSGATFGARTSGRLSTVTGRIRGTLVELPQKLQRWAEHFHEKSYSAASYIIRIFGVEALIMGANACLGAALLVSLTYTIRTRGYYIWSPSGFLAWNGFLLTTLLRGFFFGCCCRLLRLAYYYWDRRMMLVRERARRDRGAGEQQQQSQHLLSLLLSAAWMQLWGVLFLLQFAHVNLFQVLFVLPLAAVVRAVGKVFLLHFLKAKEQQQLAAAAAEAAATAASAPPDELPDAVAVPRQNEGACPASSAASLGAPAAAGASSCCSAILRESFFLLHGSQDFFGPAECQPDPTKTPRA